MKFYILNSARFVILVLIQVLILNQFNIFGYVNPYVYPLLIILLPFDINSIQKLLLAFGLGICLDFFEDSGGIHAAATLIIAYLRPILLRNVFGSTYDYQTLKFYDAAFKSKFLFVILVVFIHHTVLFSLEIFSVNHLLYLFKKIIYSSVFSIVLIMLILKLIQKTPQ